MPRPRGIILVILIVMGVMTAGTLLFGIGMHVDGFVRVRVTGRLITSGGRVPIPAAWILVIPSRSWAEGSDRLMKANGSARTWDARRRAGTGATGGLLPYTAGGAFTSIDGAFTVEVTHSWGAYRVRLFDAFDPPPLPYGTGAALLIEIEGREPRIVDAPTGTWTEHPDDDELSATYDIGVVEVPSDG